MLNRLLLLCSIVVFFVVRFLSIYQKSSYAQTLEDILGKAKEDIEKAKQSGIPLGTVSILSNSSHTDSRDILHVVGEVYNDIAPYADPDTNNRPVPRDPDTWAYHRCLNKTMVRMYEHGTLEGGS
jgi:hypothetical protein